jgi:hypothetical protein
VEIVNFSEREGATHEDEVHDVATSTCVTVHEVEVKTRHLDTCQSVGKAKPDDDAADIGTREGVLMFDRFCEWRVGLRLSLNTPQRHFGELPSNANSHYLSRTAHLHDSVFNASTVT